MTEVDESWSGAFAARAVEVHVVSHSAGGRLKQPGQQRPLSPFRRGEQRSLAGPGRFPAAGFNPRVGAPGPLDPMARHQFVSGDANPSNKTPPDSTIRKGLPVEDFAFLAWDSAIELPDTR